MNRKQLSIIIVLVVLIGGMGLFIYQRDTRSWKSSDDRMGQKLLGQFPLNDVAQVTIRNATNELNLVKQDEIWSVRERHGYPANFSDVSELVRKAWELKAVQKEKVGPSQLARLELVEPGKGAGSGTLLDFKDKGGKTIKSLLLGKKHMKKSPTPSQFGDDGWPDGRYLMVGGGPSEVSLIADAWSNVEPKPDQWLNKDFFKVEKIRSVSVTHTNATNSWKLARETEGGDMKLADLKPGEPYDTNKVSASANILSFPSFVDAVSPEAKPEDTGMDQPIVAQIATLDGFQYEIKIGKKSGEDNYHFKMSVSADLPKERVAPKDEKPEDKEKLDKEFKEKLGKQEEKLKQEQSYAKWTYLVSKWTVENLLKERKEYLASPKSDAKPDTKTDDAKKAEPNSAADPDEEKDDDTMSKEDGQ